MRYSIIFSHGTVFEIRLYSLVTAKRFILLQNPKMFILLGVFKWWPWSKIRKLMFSSLFYLALHSYLHLRVPDIYLFSIPIVLPAQTFYNLPCFFGHIVQAEFYRFEFSFPSRRPLAYFILAWLVGWLVEFYGISTFVGYLTPNPLLCK